VTTRIAIEGPVLDDANPGGVVERRTVARRRPLQR
jgi:hypothetical protein